MRSKIMNLNLLFHFAALGYNETVRNECYSQNNSRMRKGGVAKTVWI